MSHGTEHLLSLRKPVIGDDAVVEAQARSDYERLYCAGGHCSEIRMLDGPAVRFYADRFEHAFFTSPDRARHPYSKTKLAVDRIERMAWIGAMIRGEVVGTECWEVLPQSGRQHPRDRVLIHWEVGYVVWLQPNKEGNAYKFSSAYPVPPNELSRYVRGGRKKWRVEKKSAP